MLESDDQEQLTPKQQQIVQAAIEMFSEKGYASTSTSEIAKRAGVAEGTIFRHYKTKKDLLLAIVSPVITKLAVPFIAQSFVKQVFKEGEHEDFEELLRTILVNRFEFAKKNVPLLKIVLQEVAFHPELQDRYKEVFRAEVLPHFERFISHYQEQGLIKDYPTETVLRLVITTVIGFLVTRFIIMPDGEWDDEAEIDRTIDYILNGLQV
nr:TetR/AcrR family transcriptional regulator [Pontibacillus sp. HN14]